MANFCIDCKNMSIRDGDYVCTRDRGTQTDLVTGNAKPIYPYRFPDGAMLCSEERNCKPAYSLDASVALCGADATFFEMKPKA